MYIVLTAMLALNVSSDVLNGFKQVEDGLERSTSNASLQNDVLYQKLADFNSQNPEKGGPWYKKREAETYSHHFFNGQRYRRRQTHGI